MDLAFREPERYLYARTWLPIARAADIEVGKPVHARLLDTELVLVRYSTGISVFRDQCPHRGTALSIGRADGEMIECAYHGWRFDGAGTCVLIPSQPAEVSITPNTALTRLRTREAYGHVWTSLGEPLFPFPSMPHLDDGTWELVCGAPRDWNVGLRLLTENFRDVAHFPFVHRHSIGPDQPVLVQPYEVKRRDWDLEFHYPTDFGGSSITLGPQTLNYHLSAPATVALRIDYAGGGKHLVAQFVTPLSAVTCRQFWLVGVDSVLRSRGVTLQEIFDWDREIFDEDQPIAESQRPREAPLDPGLQASVRADRFPLAYRSVFREMLGVAEPLMETAVNGDENVPEAYKTSA